MIHTDKMMIQCDDGLYCNYALWLVKINEYVILRIKQKVESVAVKMSMVSCADLNVYLNPSVLSTVCIIIVVNQIKKLNKKKTKIQA